MTAGANLDWCCIAAVNSETVLHENLAASPALASGDASLHVMRDQPSASVAYNRGLDESHAELCVFAHQDVYLPRGWDARLADGVAAVAAQDPDWAVIGIYGVCPDGRHAGRVWTSGLGRELRVMDADPVRVGSIDELLIVLRRDSGLRFDEGLPGFHLYGTDIVQTALDAGRGAWVIEAPVVHNSVPVRTLRGAFLAAYDHLRRKWRQRLPIHTPVTTITSLGLAARWQNLRRFGLAGRRSERRRETMAQAAQRRDPAAIAKELGYE